MRDLLDGIRVIELAVLVNGGLVGAALGDLGADVIKIESPGRGDYLREILGEIAPHQSPAHLQVNRQKRSLAVDLKTDEGREVFWRLLETADVVVDGFVAGTTERLGVGYEEVRSRHPRIVYCQHTGFGSTGPYGHVPTHGFMQEALAAGTPMEVGPDGFPRAKTVFRTYSVPLSGSGRATPAGAVQAAFHIAAGLVRAGRTGEGCLIDVSAADAAIVNAYPAATYELNAARITSRKGLPEANVTETGPEGSARYQYYETLDGKFVVLCAIEPKFWIRFCEAISRPDLIGETNEAGFIEWASGEKDLRTILMAIFHERTQREWLELSVSDRIPLGAAYETMAELAEDPHLQEREIFYEAVHPHAGPFTYVGSPAVIPGQPYEVRRHAPLLGEQTGEILTELGYGSEEQRDFAARGITSPQ